MKLPSLLDCNILAPSFETPSEHGYVFSLLAASQAR
jgi:hypothetical protein